MSIERLRRPHRTDASGVGEFLADVSDYLTREPRQLPSKYLYDDLGSALFDAISHLPWYPLTRAEGRLIRAHGRDIFAAVDEDVGTIVELGPGNGTKLAALLEAARPLRRIPRVHLVDVSASALDRAARLVAEVSGADVVLHPTTYESGLEEVAAFSRAPGRMLALFFGSNIGNFDPPGCDAFLHMLRAALRPGDALLLGADLVKPEADLLLAYDDPLGVTSAFNRNLLVRLDRELGASLDPAAFAHRAVWNARESRVEMHLVSLRDTRVAIPACDLDFVLRAGETIWTESSYKFKVGLLEGMLRRCGFQPVRRFMDEGDRFALLMAIVA